MNAEYVPTKQTMSQATKTLPAAAPPVSAPANGHTPDRLDHRSGHRDRRTHSNGSRSKRSSSSNANGADNDDFSKMKMKTTAINSIAKEPSDGSKNSTESPSRDASTSSSSTSASSESGALSDNTSSSTSNSSSTNQSSRSSYVANPFIPDLHPVISVTERARSSTSTTSSMNKGYELCMPASNFIDVICGGNPDETSYEERLAKRAQLYNNISPQFPSEVLASATPLVSTTKKSSRKKPLLVLDLDETLVHANICIQHKPDGRTADPPASDAQVHITATWGSPQRTDTHTIHIGYRPHLRQFFTELSRVYDIAVFTAGRPIYAATLLDVMDPQGAVIPRNGRLFRSSCTMLYNSYMPSPRVVLSKTSFSSADEDKQSQVKEETDEAETREAATTSTNKDEESEERAVAQAMGVEGTTTAQSAKDRPGTRSEIAAEPGNLRVKDLGLFGRPLNEVVLLDNTPTCGLLQPRNLLPISSWIDDQNDDGLLQAVTTLKDIAHSYRSTGDVRTALDRHCASMKAFK